MEVRSLYARMIYQGITAEGIEPQGLCRDVGYYPSPLGMCADGFYPAISGRCAWGISSE